MSAMDEDLNSITQEISFQVESKKILSLDYYRSNLGVTCLDVENRKLYVYEDIEVSYPNTYVEAIVDDLGPDVVYVSSRCTEGMIAYVRSLEVERNASVFVRIVSDYTKFDLEGLAQSFERYAGTASSRLFMSVALKSSSYNISMGTLNAMYLGISDYVDSVCLAEMVDTVEPCNFKNIMFVDTDSLYALQIVTDPQMKSSGLKGSSNSLFDFLNHTVTREGYLLLRDWTRKPLANLQLIRERQAVIKEISAGSFSESRKQIFKLLSQLKSSFRKIRRLKANEMLWNSWKSLLQFLSNSVQVAKILRLYFTTSGVEVPPKFTTSILLQDEIFDFQTLSDTILSIIELESSAEEGKVRVLSGVDEEIDQLKVIYNDLESILQDCSHQLMSMHSQNFNTVYIPQLGFLVSIDIVNSASDLNLPTELEQVFVTPTNAYYKCDKVHELDEKYGDVHTLINDREIEIVQGLQEEVLNYEEKILEVIDNLVELDCLCSLAEVSALQEFTFPTLTNGFELKITNGRHILLESHSKMVVSNDVEYGDSERMIILTGANFSGKSIFLNQTALIVVLAQMGCAVPAMSAVIGVVDKLLTRISTRECLEKRQSTFAIDINQISKCIHLKTERSLVIIDEFGKGSDSIDSPALLAGTLAYFASQSDCPRCIVSTHFLELFRGNLIVDRMPTGKVKYLSTQVVLQNEQADADITYLYKIVPGICDNSYGIHCAKICGIPKAIVNRAEEIGRKLDEGKDLVNEMTLLTANEEQNYTIARDVVMKFLALDFSESAQTTCDISEFESIF
ncbi:hypothetical protein I9W82_003712 [Candida metapsilosis]|uniref:DNA mismatch repair proteins mutS family domain-containing protein n=1 Tax=Candida metapsilosis TaxID=273372 RepID=A0A8H7ZBW6_9ASCO|nr:hypothetical protein I9W82_003712 [Candida metapsilosis]